MAWACGALLFSGAHASVFAADVAAGALTLEQALLYRFHQAFAPQNLPLVYRGDVNDDPPVSRCGTPLILEYLSVRDDLAPSTTQIIDDYLAFSSGPDVFVSPGGNFRLSYAVEGWDAVPVVDVQPADGVPDFINRVADYLETARTAEMDRLKFLPPPAGDPLDVSFRRMSYYGYTVIVDPKVGRTRLVLHKDFSRFPPNDDPDGNAIGSARAAAAHELKHASQYAGSRWSEGGWVELDATWVEDCVFDQVNDYQNYLGGDSPVRRPQLSLDAGSTGTGSYEDSVFQHWLEQRWGSKLIRRFWDRRVEHRTEKVLDTWDAVLVLHGTSLASAWGDFVGWNFATGSRAVAGVGYREAADYPEGDLVSQTIVYPSWHGGRVEHLAAAPVMLKGLESLGDRLLTFDFDGENSAEHLVLALHVMLGDGGGYLETIGLDAANDGRFVLGVPATRLRAVGVIVGNGAADGPSRFWTLKVDTIAGPAPPVMARLIAVDPNPCNPAAWLSCDLTDRTNVQLDVMDARGRRVSRVWSGPLSPGRHRFRWDGDTDAGRPAAAGMYLVRLGTPQGVHCRKLTLVR